MDCGQTLVLDFEDESSQECPLMYIEIPENQVQPGDQVEIRLWGPQEQLAGWSLCVFGEPLGSGELGTLQDPVFTQQVDLPETLEAELEYPITELTEVLCLTPLTFIDAQTPWPPVVWQNRGSEISAFCSRKGHSCLQVACERPLYGALQVTCLRVGTYLRWFWTIPNSYYGDVWFFLYNDVTTLPYRKFAVGLPDLASVEVGERNLSLEALDFATDDPVPGAAVYIDGLYVGATGEDGLIHVPSVATGEHPFKATCEGYLPTDQDGLSNERIVVT